MDTQNLWINLKHSLADQDRLKIYNIVQELETNNCFFDVTNDTVLSFDDIKDKKCKYLTIAHPFDDRINAEGTDLKPIKDQTPYTDLLTIVSKITKQVMNDFKLDRDIMFHCASIIFIPANSTFVPHIDSFRKCNISFPLALEGSTTYWLTPDRYETVYNTTTILNTEIKHSVENRTSKHRFVFQLNFKPNLGINDIRGNFDEYVK